MRFRRAFFAAVADAAPTALAVACGARTPLVVPDFADADAGSDARRDARRDAVPDVPLPPIDASPRDANRNDCPDADSTLVYLVTEQTELLSFYPPAASFQKIGNIGCNAQNGATPFSMGVDRKGIAQVVYSDGELFRVSTATASCASTPFKGDSTFQTFGMGYSTIGAGPAEELYIAATDGTLGKLDFMSWTPVHIAMTQPTLAWAELTGTGDGRLYAFYRDDNAGTGIAELDKATAKVIGEDPLPSLSMGQAWAFAFWGGDFYLFTESSGVSHVTRFRPTDKTLVEVATYNGLIVGAGVSTCAPSQ